MAYITVYEFGACPRKNRQSEIDGGLAPAQKLCDRILEKAGSSYQNGKCAKISQSVLGQPALHGGEDVPSVSFQSDKQQR
ncbi:MAG: hypothetical protein M1321_01675 [Candidatus Marsarchaeota archaeon]|nr:hypothetical protein [Candidatus Marsarchaeota archaeon]